MTTVFRSCCTVFISKDMDKCEALVAIDFGTSNIGFAYSFPPDKDKIYLATYASSLLQGEEATPEITNGSTIKDGTVALSSVHVSKMPHNRVPTVLLLNADGTINAFGKLAVDRYAQLVVTKRHQGYRYFDTFKMELYENDNLTRESEIQDSEGRKISALELFSKLIRYIGKLALHSIREAVSNNSKVNPNSVFWMLTIPAIWSDSARQFMREAAAEAGIPRDRIRLVREPEAATIFWKTEMKNSDNINNIEKLSVGNKYIIADLGGGIVDICVHEILPDNRFRELLKATGNDLGGNSVDNMFIQFLMNIVSDKVWKIFFRQQYFNFVKLMRSFEEIKMKFDKETEKIIIELPPSLIKLAEENAKSAFSDIVKASEEREYVTVEDKTKLRLKKETVESFFKPSIDGIVNMLKEILKECDDVEINNLILAGGYSASMYVTDVIKKAMDTMEVTHVPEQDLAVLKGAVLMGFEPVDNIERRARYCYGFAVARPFEEKNHPKNLRFYRDGKLLCRDIFHKVIDKNQLLKVGDRFKVETRNNDRKFFQFKQRDACAQLFRSTEDNPKYCIKEEGCTEVFTLRIEAPKGGWSERLCTDYVLVVGDTDFEVLAFDIFTGRKHTTTEEIL